MATVSMASVSVKMVTLVLNATSKHVLMHAIIMGSVTKVNANVIRIIMEMIVL